MKKIFIALIICILLTIGVMTITRSEILHNRLVKDIKIEEISINDLEITTSTYWYNTLNEDEKRIYRIIAKGVMELDKTITIDVAKDNNFEVAKEDIETALNAFFADHPEVFYINDEYEISLIDMLVIKIVNLKLRYISDDEQEIETMKQELNAQIERINSKLVNAKNDYEKELLIHDILASEIVYFSHENYTEIPNIKHTAYSALVNKSAVCDGITKAFQLILNKNNIESIFVTGMSEDVPHAWCKVKIEDEYYNVDLTSDKALNEENRDLVIHSYFNITDQEIMNTHSFDNYNELPSSTANKFNYYIYNDYTISYFDNFEYKIREIIKKQSLNGLLEFKTSGINDVPDKMVNSLYNLNFNNIKTNNITKVKYTKINDNYIVVK